MLLALLVFVLVAGAIVGGYYAYTTLPERLANKRLQERLQGLSTSPKGGEDDSVLARPKQGPLPIVDRIVSASGGGMWLSRLIQQSGVHTTPSAVVIMTIVMAAAAAMLANIFTQQAIFMPVAAAIFGSVPILFLMNRRSKRIRTFEEHFPEALDLLSRALRAGHAFQTAMGMVAEEMKEPIGPEFKKCFDQQNFGLPLRDALVQLSERVPLLDVRFFVTAVLIQRDTGGNLSEILDNLAHVVRERFKVLRQVRVHTAHGRFTAFVLLSLPAALGIILTMINPDHMNPLFHDRMGQTMLIVATIMQGIGFVWIRKVIKIEV
ncbi:MAG TPA: type II secretion system F family protein [Vicinamibacterales bacterium]|jgi:tight adherence protein B